jgi:hypothetical protein
MQDEQVYFVDPLALHHIVLKEQDIFQETAMFIEYVVMLVSSWSI